MLFLIAWVGVVVVVVGGTGADSTFNGTWAKALMQLNTASLCPAANIASWNCEWFAERLSTSQGGSLAPLAWTHMPPHIHHLNNPPLH